MSELTDLVHRVVVDQARHTPDALALAGPQALTYGQLEERAGTLAVHLAELGVGPGVSVALLLPRSPAFVIGALGTLAAGCAYVPLDPAYPVDRLALILDDTASAALVTDSATAHRLPSGSWSTVVLDTELWVRGACPRLASSVLAADSLAYIIYTSGSTGRPKGVEIPHIGLANLVRWHLRAFDVGPRDRAMQFASPGFDAAVWEIWPYLAVGASVHFPDEAQRLDPRWLRDWIVAERITIGFVPTPVAERLIALAWPATTALRVLLTGADTLHRHPPASLPFALVNNYGQTECSVVATSGVVPPEAEPQRLPTIGRPIDHVELHLLDQHGRRVADGEVGEMYIGGGGLARGYRNLPALTAARFLPDPFSNRPGARIYRTGDRGRRLGDGEIEFLGRLDDQVKIRGYRIEPDEIVTALDALPSVEASAVAAKDDDRGERQLVAYIVRAPGSRLSPTELRRSLAATLPEPMLPAHFVELDAIPLSANGKVDRAALPDPEAGLVLRDEQHVAPRSSAEASLAAIVADLLSLKRVGVLDNFFLLGGHSLLGTQLIARVFDTFGVQLSLRTLFDHPTVGSLAAEIEETLAARIETNP
ncbi:MAG: hypothetical protein DMD95_02715 [Candidatus Rokuibacteriota bacterium]|nr:MAG: hypothetical protein DMD95_02715 [Candidatus Rokubacteria bacterium]